MISRLQMGHKRLLVVNHGVLQISFRKCRESTCKLGEIHDNKVV